MVSSVSSSAVDGLVSGLDTASIISKLIAVDAAPQTAMQNSVTTAQAKVTAYQSVNTKLSALQTAAQNLTRASSWTAAKASSSTDGVTVTAGSTAQPGSLNVYVQQLATGRSVITDSVSATEDAAAKLGFPLDVINPDGTYAGKVDINKGTLPEVAAAINKASSTLGISAVALRISDGVYRLQITSTKTGSAGGFSLVPPTGATQTGQQVGHPAEEDKLKLTEMSQAQNAEIYLTPGAVAPDGTLPYGSIPITSPTNTFSDLMQGVTVTATKTGAATVSVATDPAVVSDSVKALVDAANAALTSITSATKSGTIGSDGTSRGAGALSGNSTLRALKTSILAAVTSALGGTTSAAKYGIESTRDGALTFTADTFKAAYAADPATVQRMLAPTSVDPASRNPGLVERVVNVAQGATGINPLTSVASGKGTLELAIAGQNSTISDLTRRISDWDLRLAAKKASYQKYYSNLEVALGKLQSQSTWLSGQLASLNKG